MVTINSFRKIALSLPESVEEPHFHLTSFRIDKKIFATLDEKNNRACLMFSPEDQSVFCAFDRTIIYPVPNKWGLGGATYVELKKVRQDLLKDALKTAYEGKKTGKKKE